MLTRAQDPHWLGTASVADLAASWWEARRWGEHHPQASPAQTAVENQLRTRYPDQMRAYDTAIRDGDSPEQAMHTAGLVGQSSPRPRGPAARPEAVASATPALATSESDRAGLDQLARSATVSGEHGAYRLAARWHQAHNSGDDHTRGVAEAALREQHPELMHRADALVWRGAEPASALNDAIPPPQTPASRGGPGQSPARAAYPTSVATGLDQQPGSNPTPTPAQRTPAQQRHLGQQHEQTHQQRR